VPLNPYQLLGIRPTASTEEIRQAYRDLARRYHPDVNQDPGALEHFKQVGQAFSILSDPRKRALFDEFGEESLRLHFDPLKARQRRTGSVQRRAPPPANQGPWRPEPQRPQPGGPRPGRRAAEDRAAPSADVAGPLEIDLRLALVGGTIRVPSPLGGAPVTVEIPAGVRSGARVRVPGRGRHGVHGGRPGDLVLEVRVLDHPHFTRLGDDLQLRLPLTLEEALQGANVEIPTLDGRLTVAVPAGSRGGEQLRVKGHGSPRAGGQRGDLYVLLCIRLPERAHAAQREVKRLEQLYTRPVRRDLKL
jgi:DnaJ-class molecular chaperone